MGLYDIEINGTQLYIYKKTAEEILTEEFIQKYLDTMGKHADSYFNGSGIDSNHSWQKQSILNFLEDDYKAPHNQRLFAFDGGICILQISSWGGKKALKILLTYIEKESPINKKLFWKEFDGIAKQLDCKYLIGNSVRNPKAWERLYGYEILSYEIGKKIK